VTGDRGEAELTLGAGGGEEVVTVPWPLLLRRRLGRRARRLGFTRESLVLATVLVGLFSVNVVFTVIAVALPRISRELGTTTSVATWAVTGGLLAYGVAAPVLGKAGDVYGHRRLYLLGMAGAHTAAVVSALAPNVGTLIAARVLAASCGAATGAASMAIVFRSFPPEERVKAMGYWSLVGAGGPVIGVALGAPVVEAIGWRWVFAAQVPFGLLALGLGAAVLRETERGKRRRLDWAGALLLAGSVTSLLVALNRGPSWGWSSVPVVAGLLACPVLAAAFVRVERRAEHPLIPLAWFRRRNFAFPVTAMAFSNFAYMGGFILAPLLLAGPLFGFGESRIGLLSLSRPLAFSLSAPLAGYVALRTGERVTATVGAVAIVVSMVVFSRVGAGDVGTVLAGLVLSGVGMGLAMPSLTAVVANAVDEADFGVAGAANQLLSQVGVVAGVQLMQTVQVARAFADAYLLGGAVAVVGVLCAVAVRSTDRRLATR
jgi:EmrB/QacA subfamily drug resistance transporter